jgi:hypothetical protein
MSQTPLIRCRAAAVALVAGLAAGVLAIPTVEVATGTATPAHASSWRTARSGPSNAEPVKAVAVNCPDGSVPYAGGGAVDYRQAGNGGAALTAIVPNLATNSVVVTATAPAGQTANWALVAFAICSTFDLDPEVVVHTGLGTAAATCDDDMALFGAGFRVGGDPSVSHVTGIDLNPDVTGVLVTAGGPGGATANVTAIAVCGPAGLPTELVHASNDGAGWPKLVTRQDNDEDLKPYATGAAVTGPDAATLDAVVPASDDGVSWARGTLYGGTAPESAFARAEGDGDDGDDGSVRLETALIGTFH